MDPLLLQVLNGYRPSQTPVWFMRQAGRFLPEYREVRKQYTFDQVLNDPQLSKQVTLQPIQRFPKLDGAIIFSDILIVLNALGCRVSFEHGSPSIGRTLDQISIDDAVDYSHFDTVQKALKATRLISCRTSPSLALQEHPGHFLPMLVMDPIRMVGKKPRSSCRKSHWKLKLG